MSSLAAISKIDFPFKANQKDVKQYAKELFEPSFPQVERMLPLAITGCMRTVIFVSIYREAITRAPTSTSVLRMEQIQIPLCHLSKARPARCA